MRISVSFASFQMTCVLFEFFGEYVSEHCMSSPSSQTAMFDLRYFLSLPYIIFIEKKAYSQKCMYISTRTDLSTLKVSVLLRQKIVQSNRHFNRRRSSLFPSVGSDSIFDDLNKFRRLLCRNSDSFRADRRAFLFTISTAASEAKHTRTRAVH